jgi:hypothetical protein
MAICCGIYRQALSAFRLDIYSGVKMVGTDLTHVSCEEILLTGLDREKIIPLFHLGKTQERQQENQI